MPEQTDSIGHSQFPCEPVEHDLVFAYADDGVQRADALCGEHGQGADDLAEPLAPAQPAE